MSLHFSKKGNLQIDSAQKVRSFETYISGSSKKLDLILSVASSNQLFRYKFDMKAEDEENAFTLQNKIGSTIGCHQGPIRGVVISGNDYLMATYSFDSVKLWQIDFNAQQNSLKVLLK